MAYRVGVDVGGTFTDFCEFPIYIPTVAVTSIGAGGGSIAWVDDLGVLKVGPESAGSSPGPACYGRGGERPTITDAFAVLGYIGQFELDNSAISIDADMARAAVDRGRTHRTQHRGGRPGHCGHRRVRNVRGGEQAHLARRH